MLRMRWRLASRATSPRCSPASAAALSSSTRATITPSSERRLSCRLLSRGVGRAVEWGGEGTGVEAEEALALAARVDGLCGFLGRLAELDLEHPLPLVPPDPDGYALAGRGGRHDLLEVLGRVHALAVELHQH